MNKWDPERSSDLYTMKSQKKTSWPVEYCSSMNRNRKSGPMVRHRLVKSSVQWNTLQEALSLKVVVFVWKWVGSGCRLPFLPRQHKEKGGKKRLMLQQIHKSSSSGRTELSRSESGKAVPRVTEIESMKPGH